jgi:hypothetical protein
MQQVTAHARVGLTGSASRDLDSNLTKSRDTGVPGRCRDRRSSENIRVYAASVTPDGRWLLLSAAGGRGSLLNERRCLEDAATARVRLAGVVDKNLTKSSAIRAGRGRACWCRRVSGGCGAGVSGVAVPSSTILSRGNRRLRLPKHHRGSSSARGPGIADRVASGLRAASSGAG